MSKRKRKGKIAVIFAAAMMSTAIGEMTLQADTNSSDPTVPEGVVLNYHEMEAWDTSFADEDISDIPCSYGVLPESYSSSSKIVDSITVDSKKDYVTESKYQSGGTCWAHAATSIAETSYIKNEGITDTINSDTINFNEYHLVHYTYHSPADPLNLFGGDTTENISEYSDLESGGNVENSLCNYANWIGASADTDFSSDDVAGNHSDELAFEDAAHLENGYILSMPDMSADAYENDMNVIKQMIMDYGSVSVSYYAGSSTYYANGYQYCDSNLTTNHAVTIVGWDDTISASLFNKTPEGDGAWLVKNSWGTSWGLNGYFWLSYYDASIGENAVVLDFTTAENYDNNYQYDGSGNVWGATSGYENQTAAANAFVADSAESLEAIGFYTYHNNMDYEIRIYRNLEADALPNTGDLVLTQSGSETYAGFHTVKLSNAIPLKEGERYAVAITWKKEGSYVFVRADRTREYSWISCTSYAKAGQSYWGYSVDRLSDLNPNNTDYADGTNIRIKAFTNEIKVVNTTGISLDQTSATLESGASLQLTATILPTNATYQGVTFSSGDESIATVDVNGLVTANSTGKTGTTTITATSEEGNKTATCKITVKPILINGITLDKTSATLIPGTTTTIKATVTPSNVTNSSVNWSSSNTTVATVDQSGTVTALSEGTVTITVTAADGSGQTGKCVILVDHDWNTTYTIDKAATCTEAGSKSIHCKNCTATKEAQKIAKIAHSWDSGTVTKQATCTETGILTKHCNNCTATATESISATGHSWNNTYTIDKAATCTEAGSKSIHCKNCTATKDAQTIAKIAHATVIDSAVAATYTSTGKTEGSHCSVCGTVTQKQETISARSGLAPAQNGVRSYYDNGKVKTSLTTLLNENGIWYYVEKGVVSGKYTGLVRYNGSWYYVKNSKADFSYTGLCKYGSNWYYVQKGMLTWNYTGLCKYGSSWYYVKSGVLNWNYTGLCKYGTQWYYVKNGVLNWNYTGLCKYGSSWYYVKNGVLNWNYTGLCKYGSSWYYVQNGVLNWNYTSLCKYGAKWYYVNKGVVNFKYTGYTNYGGARWCVKNGVMVKKA